MALRYFFLIHKSWYVINKETKRKTIKIREVPVCSTILPAYQKDASRPFTAAISV